MVGVSKPTNKILVAGNPVIREFKAVAATIYPGHLVQFDTSDIEIAIGGAATGTNALGIGIVDWNSAHESYKPATRATAYADNAFIPVIMCGSGSIVMAYTEGGVESGGVLTGQAGDGALITGTIGTNHVYAIALEDLAVTDVLTPILLL